MDGRLITRFLNTKKISSVLPNQKIVFQSGFQNCVTQNRTSSVIQFSARTLLKCDLCEFEARNSNGLTMHKKSKHTDKSIQSGYLFIFLTFTFIFSVFRHALFGVKTQPHIKFVTGLTGKKDSYVYRTTLVTAII